MEQLLGQTWVLVAVFTLGPAILFFIYLRKKREEEAKNSSPKRGARASTTPGSERASASGVKTKAAEDLPVVPRRPITPGFRDMTWGQSPPETMHLVHDGGVDRLMSRPGDEMKIGNTQIQSIQYAFYKNRLQAVIIELPVFGFDLLVNTLKADWGPPRFATDRSKCYWLDLLAGSEATKAVLEKRPESRMARLMISSKAIQTEREKEAARKT